MTHRALLLAAFCAALSGAGCTPGSDAPSPGAAAATVDGTAISQAALRLAAPANGSAAARAAALDQLVTEQLMANAALKQGLEREPDVAAALESARRQALARAYVESKARLEPALQEAELRAFYDAHPELFADRKIYRVQELAIEVPASRVGEIANQLKGFRTLGERADWLRRQGIPYKANVAVRAAEEWPADLLPHLRSMKDGAAFDMSNPRGFSVLQLTGVERQALSFEQARDRISVYLVNQRGSALFKREAEALRRQAKVELSDTASGSSK